MVYPPVEYVSRGEGIWFVYLVTLRGNRRFVGIAVYNAEEGYAYLHTNTGRTKFYTSLDELTTVVERACLKAVASKSQVRA